MYLTFAPPRPAPSSLLHPADGLPWLGDGTLPKNKKKYSDIKKFKKSQAITGNLVALNEKKKKNPCKNISPPRDRSRFKHCGCPWHPNGRPDPPATSFPKTSSPLGSLSPPVAKIGLFFPCPAKPVRPTAQPSFCRSTPQQAIDVRDPSVSPVGSIPPRRYRTSFASLQGGNTPAANEASGE